MKILKFADGIIIEEYDGTRREPTKSELQIINANNAYIIQLREKTDNEGVTVVFAIYTQKNNEVLEPLWAKNINYDNYNKSELFKYQKIARKNSKLPKFIFKLGGYGYNKEYELAEMLQEYNPQINVYKLSGAYPWLILEGKRG